MPDSSNPEEYHPQIISRDPFTEGGFTFLKRALATALEDEKGQVVIDTSGMKLTYVHDPENETFMDGIQNIEGDSPRTLEAFRGVATQYLIELGLREIAEEQD